MDDGSRRSREDLEIEKTENGKAVFALRDFRSGEFIIEFRGKPYTREQYIRKLNPKNNHFLQIDENLYLGPTRTADNYINHSCNPNSGMKIQNNHVLLYAIKPIKKGDEITFDYSTSMDENYWEMDCRCGSRNCRKRIRDFKHLPAEVKSRYIKLGIVPDFILRNLK